MGLFHKIALTAGLVAIWLSIVLININTWYAAMEDNWKRNHDSEFPFIFHIFIAMAILNAFAALGEMIWTS